MTSPDAVNDHSVDDRKVKNLMRYFGILYWTEGWAQASGIISLPLFFFGAEVLGWDAKAVTAYIAILGVPWVIKPLYGLVSDAFPLFGYRRKSYLIALNLAAFGGFVALMFVTSAFLILSSLLVITVAMAASSSLCGGLLVENGKSTGHNTDFCSQQTLWVNLANISAAAIGTLLVATFAATQSLHTAALITACAPLAVVLATWKLIDEPKVNLGLKKQLIAVEHGIVDALRSRVLWFVAAFLVLWAFNPGFGTPLKFYMREHLHFDKSFIGWLSSAFALGAAIGAILFRWFAAKVNMNLAVFIVVILGALIQLMFLYMAGPVSAVALHVLNGAATAASGLAVHVVAANKCPKNAEAFVYGALLSLTNASFFGSEYLGGIIYQDYLGQDMHALIKLSALLTLMCLIVLPCINFEKDDRATWAQLAWKRVRRAKNA